MFSCENDLNLLGNIDFFLNFDLRKIIAPIDKENAVEAKVSSATPNSEFNHGFTKPYSNKRPKLTYPQILAHCLQQCGPLPVKDIYRWMAEQHPYFRLDNHIWKNAVRHNLSSLPQFIKGEKLQNSGHMWYLDNNLVKGKRLYSKKQNALNCQVPESSFATPTAHCMKYGNSQHLQNSFYSFNQDSGQILSTMQHENKAHLGGEFFDMLPCDFSDVVNNENVDPNVQPQQTDQDIFALDWNFIFNSLRPEDLPNVLQYEEQDLN